MSTSTIKTARLGPSTEFGARHQVAPEELPRQASSARLTAPDQAPAPLPADAPADLVPPQHGSGTQARAQRRERTAQLFSEYRACTDETTRKALLGDVVLDNLGVAEALAQRYRNRGLPAEDLQQVAYVALIRAAQKFDPEAGHDFLSYCVPTVRGELRRHFRDQGWMVRPTRRIQELQQSINAAEEELVQRLGHSPSARDFAEHLDENLDDVIEALAGDGCFAPASLDLPVGDDAGASLGEMLGAIDGGHLAAEARAMLEPAVARLDERDRRIVQLRFVEDLTQAEIASRIGVTQMQVSRLLSRILKRLRAELDGAVMGPSAASR